MKMYVFRSILAGLLLGVLEGPCLAAPENPPARLRDNVLLKGHQGMIVFLVFTPDGKALISQSDRDPPRLWDVAKRERRSFLEHGPPGLFGGTCGLTLSPDGKTVATWDNNGMIVTWSVASGKVIANIGKAQGIDALVFGPDGKTLSVGFPFGPDDKPWDTAFPFGIRVYDVQKLKEVRLCKMRSRLAPVSSGRPIKQPLMAIRHRGSRYLVDAITGESSLNLGPEASEDGYFTINDSETLLASVVQGHFVRLWDRTTGRNIATFEEADVIFTSLAFSPDGNTLAVGYRNKVPLLETARNGGFLLYEVPSGKILAHKREDGGITSVAFSPDGRVLAAGGRHDITLWTIPDAWRKKDKEARPPAAEKKEAK